MSVNFIRGIGVRYTSRAHQMLRRLDRGHMIFPLPENCAQHQGPHAYDKGLQRRQDEHYHALPTLADQSMQYKAG
jgi:hypothetical protein